MEETIYANQIIKIKNSWLYMCAFRFHKPITYKYRIENRTEIQLSNYPD